MTIIQEMRRIAERCENQGMVTIAVDARDLADRLDLSGALVPVPDGEACEISKIAICGCFLFNDTEFRLYSFSCEEFGAWQLSDHTEHLFAPDTIVQPVRLVLLKDADL
jgi:hypothetical protein